MEIHVVSNGYVISTLVIHKNQVRFVTYPTYSLSLFSGLYNVYLAVISSPSFISLRAIRFINRSLCSTLQLGVCEWLKNPPSGVLEYPFSNLSSLICVIPRFVPADISLVENSPNPSISELLIVNDSGSGLYMASYLFLVKIAIKKYISMFLKKYFYL